MTPVLKSARPTISTPATVRVPTVLQQAEIECGAASLAMVLAAFGRWIPLDRLREDCGVSRDGSSALNLVKAAQRHGLQYKAMRGDAENLSGLVTPAIIWWRRSHFMVLEGVRDDVFQVNDPALGRYRIALDEFAEGYSGIAISLTRGDGFAPEGHRYRPWSALRARLQRSRRAVQLILLVGVLAMLLGVAVGPLNELLINQALASRSNHLLLEVGVALLTVGLVSAGLTLLQFGVIARLQAALTVSGTAAFTDRLLRLPLPFHVARTVGDLSQRGGLTADVARLLANQLATAGVALIGAIGYAVLLVAYSAWIGLVVILLSATNVLVLRLVTEHRTTLQARVIKRQNELRGTAAATIAGIETLKASGMEDDAFATVSGYQAQYLTAQASLVPSSVLLTALPTLTAALTWASIFVIGGAFVINGSLTIGALLALQVLALGLNAPVQTLMATGSQLQVVTANLQALDDVLANEEDPRFARSGMPDQDAPLDPAGRVELRGVTFGHSRLAPPLLEGFDLVIEPGRRIALVGASGSGKTTVANLVAGLLMPWSGSVLYDGKPLSAYMPGVIERTLAKVDQTIVLFEGTVRENVTLWDETIREERVRAALADAQILDDVLARDGGLDAVVTENGRNFSGGQCQRLEIARALVLDPRVVVLDEATSALDDVTEQRVDTALRRRGVTCLIVAHRLSTIRDADEILVLAPGGAVLERGRHEDLLASGGTYARMVADAGAGGHVGD